MAVGGINSNWQHGTHGALTSLTNFTSKTLSVDNPLETDMIDNTTFGNGSRTFEPGLSKSTVSVKYKYDDTIWGQLTSLYSNKEGVSYKHSPNGTSTGTPNMTGSAYIAKIGLQLGVGNLMEIAVDWQISGAVTFGTN